MCWSANASDGQYDGMLSTETLHTISDNVHTSCSHCPCVNERNQDNRSVPFGQDTDLCPFGLDISGIPVKQQEQYILEELKPGLPEYDTIVANFSRMKIKVTKIVRLQNMGLLERFKAEEDKVKKDRGNDANLIVRYLYHATCIKKKHICENGLDQSSSTHGSKGHSLYFSIDPRKCLQNSMQCNRQDEKMILKCRVILNEQVSPKDLTEYVVHEHRRVLVEYIIFFEVDSEQQANEGGVTEGSVAAKWKSFIGDTRGSWFATAQATAAFGLTNEVTRLMIGLFIGILTMLLHHL
ncbi:hypothetical protein ACJMK2_023801 [Sinanodonta woodiana]|uniref:PARP n=1 Tax=Sinanodonta woodiana TaxID=1069815 RepID=A0ABD3T5F2_SINWO